MSSASAVYVQINDAMHNEVLAFESLVDGRLVPLAPVSGSVGDTRSESQVARYDRRNAQGARMTERHHDLGGASWRTSSLSQSGGECVQAAFLPDGSVALRHSKDPDGSVLIYTRREWDAFLKGAKAGEFDLA